MDLLLIRHGIAIDEASGLDDSGRYLTEKGRKRTRKVGRWLAKKGEVLPRVLWTSPLVRAVQTAELVAGALGLDEVTAVSELSPSATVTDLLRRITEARLSGPLGLVGHEPLLSMVANALLETNAIRLKKSALLALTWSGGDRATFRYSLDPKTLRVSKSAPSTSG
jgi:phosphohistidine phosphatase